MLAFNGAGQAQGQAHGLKIAYLQVHVRGRTATQVQFKLGVQTSRLPLALRQAVTGLVNGPAPVAVLLIQRRTIQIGQRNIQAPAGGRCG